MRDVLFPRDRVVRFADLDDACKRVAAARDRASEVSVSIGISSASQDGSS